MSVPESRWAAFTSDELSAMTAWATAAGGIAGLREEASEFGLFAGRLYSEMQSEIDRRVIAQGYDPSW